MTRTISIIFSILLILTSTTLAQDDGYQDVVYLKNGSIIRGMITEQVPGKSVKIKTADGNVFVFSFEEIDKITKDKQQPVYNEIESYYFDYTVGYPFNSYPETTQRSIDELRKQADITRFPFAGGFSVYWPLRNNQTMVGPSFFGTFEGFSRQVSQGISSGTLNFWVIQFGASLQHYFTSNIGDGLFGRFDLGLAFPTIEIKSGNTTTTYEGDTGFAFLSGLGYSWPVSSGTRLTATVKFIYRNLPGEDNFSKGFEKGSYTSTVIAASILW